MKTTLPKVNNLLKLRTPQQVANEINELEKVKSSLRHFLANYNATFHYSECVPVAELNLSAIKKSLRELYMELEQIKAAIAMEMRQSTNKVSATAVPYQYTETEKHAIMLFNSDRRFSVTE